MQHPRSQMKRSEFFPSTATTRIIEIRRITTKAVWGTMVNGGFVMRDHKNISTKKRATT